MYDENGKIIVENINPHAQAPEVISQEETNHGDYIWHSRFAMYPPYGIIDPPRDEPQAVRGIPQRQRVAY